ncbi:Pr6Pr family membrane protein [Actinocorallia populi]|uniref:Pr6Pr family membrane protein n=1 Tax=Actinocorallia populi TaxID=2079200 RepID=UPI000D09147D|nr:Pr6Pr family membrane protein [Actinocorallia populi]
MHKRVTSAAFWSLLAVLVVLGETASFIAHGQKDQAVYFTNQSNVYLGIVAALAGWRLWSGRRELSLSVLTSAILFICITGLVYNIVLAPTAGPKHGYAAFSNAVLHLATPVLGLLGWLVFARHGSLRYVHALIWLVYPLGYFAFAIVRGVFVTSGDLRYPYPFLDVVKLGYAGVATNAVTYATLFFLLGAILVTADRLLGRIGSAVPGEPGRADTNVPCVTPMPKR